MGGHDERWYLVQTGTGEKDLAWSPLPDDASQIEVELAEALVKVARHLLPNLPDNRIPGFPFVFYGVPKSDPMEERLPRLRRDPLIPEVRERRENVRAWTAEASARVDSAEVYHQTCERLGERDE
jgi:hypothetical protein